MSSIKRCVVILACLLSVAWAHAQAPDLKSMDLVMRSLPPGPVAFIDEEPIRRDDFERLYTLRLEALKTKINANPDDNARVGIAIACLSELAQQAFLTGEAERRNIHVSGYEVSEAYAAELEKLGKLGAAQGAAPLSEAEILKKVGQNIEEVRERIRRSLRMKKAVDALLEEEKVKVTDDEIRAFYESRRDAFRGGANLHLKQILIKPGPVPRNATEEQWTAARKRIDKAAARVRAGERFEAVAKDLSEAPDAERGGDMGVLLIREGGAGLPPFLLEAAAGLKPGGLSGIVRSEFGWHLIKLISRAEAGNDSFEAAAPRIRAFLHAAKAERALDAIIQPILQDPGRVHIYLQLPKSLAAKLRSAAGAP